MEEEKSQTQHQNRCRKECGRPIPMANKNIAPHCQALPPTKLEKSQTYKLLVSGNYVISKVHGGLGLFSGVGGRVEGNFEGGERVMGISKVMVVSGERRATDMPLLRQIL